MDCKDCGACCLGQNIPVSAALGDRVSSEFVDTHGCLKKVEGACVFFDHSTRLCGQYPNRPRTCVRFLPGSARCLYVRMWAEVRLDWFNRKRSNMPTEAEMVAPFEPEMNSEDMTVYSIPGMEREAFAPAVGKYNEAVRHAEFY